MAKGLQIVSGSVTQVHKLLDDGTAVLSGTLSITGPSTFTGSLGPDQDGVREIGSPELRFADFHAVQTTVGAVFEYQMRTRGICVEETGTVLVWRENGLEPSSKEYDILVQGVSKKGKDEPIVMGAEPVLVTGDIKIGDWIVTSGKRGHGMAAKQGRFFKKDLTGKIIAQALENGSGESHLVKAMIGKK